NAGNRAWPAARVYRLIGSRWRQVLDEEREYPFGTATFLRASGHIVRNTIVAKTRDEPRHLMAAMSGPFLTYIQTWHVLANRIKRSRVRLVRNAFAELDRLAGLAQSHQRTTFNAAVPKPFQQKLWSLLKDSIHVGRGDRDEETCDTFT